MHFIFLGRQDMYIAMKLRMGLLVGAFGPILYIATMSPSVSSTGSGDFIPVHLIYHTFIIKEHWDGGMARPSTLWIVRMVFEACFVGLWRNVRRLKLRKF